MKKRSRRSLILLSAAAICLSSPAAIRADETEAATEQEAEFAENAEESEGDEAEGGEAATEEEVMEEPPVDYYIQVAAPDGLQIHQDASALSPLSISIAVPSGTLLHITGEITESNGTVWGYTSYADLKGGYVNLSAGTAKVSISSAREEAERLRQNGNWGNQFVKVDGAGTPITFNNVSKEELDAAEAASHTRAANSKTSDQADSESGAEDESAEAETDENGEPIDDGTNDDTVQITKSDGSSATAPGSGKSGGGFSILSYALGSLTIILLEAVVACLLIVSKKVRIRKKTTSEGDDGGGKGAGGKKDKKDKKKGKKKDDESGEGDGSEKKKKKKGKLKIKLPKLSIGKKKKKKGKEDEE
ncbi:hypothetical protein ACTQ56_07805 [[Clostridium] aminophilum]|uniref:hypothetical protein n=1 Tax=[Clostridium] aminophilum TaxID=1526 RepID=UPI003F94F699